MKKETRKEALKRAFQEELAANPGVPPRRSVVVRRIGNGMTTNFNGELAALWRNLQFSAGFLQGKNGRFYKYELPYDPDDLDSIDTWLRSEVA